MALEDIDPTAQRARLSCRRAATLFEEHTASMKGGPFRATSAEAQRAHPWISIGTRGAYGG